MATRVAIGLIVLGVLLVSFAVVVNHSQRSIVARFPVPTEAGRGAEASFAPAAPSIHEIELEVRLSALDDEAYEAVWAKAEPSPIGLRWQVLDAAGSLVAQGDSREFLYFPKWRGMRDRVLDRVLHREDHRSLRDGTIARGVGSFRADSSAEYTLRIFADDIPSGVATAAPHMVVRHQRAMVRSQRSRTNRLAWSGFSSLIAGSAVLMFGAARRRRPAA